MVGETSAIPEGSASMVGGSLQNVTCCISCRPGVLNRDTIVKYAMAFSRTSTFILCRAFQPEGARLLHLLRPSRLAIVRHELYRIAPDHPRLLGDAQLASNLRRALVLGFYLPNCFLLNRLLVTLLRHHGREAFRVTLNNMLKVFHPAAVNRGSLSLSGSYQATSSLTGPASW